MINKTINGKEFKFANTLRVAYTIQGMNNHKPYLDVFKGIENAKIEDQVKILYAAYKVALTSEGSQEGMNETEFLNYVLDNMDLKELMSCISDVIKGITGADTPETDVEPKN